MYMNPYCYCGKDDFPPFAKRDEGLCLLAGSFLLSRNDRRFDDFAIEDKEKIFFLPFWIFDLVVAIFANI